MTEHVRTGYRRHRKGTWAAVLAVLAVALAVVPLATGAPSKFYTLAVNPTSACSTPTTQTFTLTLVNQTRNQNLGSANITAPSYITLKDAGKSISGTTYSSFTVNQPDSFDSTANTIRLRGLNLPTTGSTATITVQADVTPGPPSGGTSSWTSIVKQSNTFADSGPGNLFAIQGSAPSTTVSACHYAFVQGPADAVKNVPQTVKVQLQDSSNSATNVTGPLTLSASQNGSGVSSFTGLAASAPDATGTLAGKQWTFSVTGTVSGSGYALTAGTTTSTPAFTISDCVPTDGTCNVGFTDNGDGTGGAAFNGAGLTSSGIILSFETIPPQGANICNVGWGWQQLTFPPQPPPDGRTTFDGITLGSFSFSKSTGFMKVTTYLRNDLFVQTSASQTNDIQICAGAVHANSANASSDGSTFRAFLGRNGTPAKWDVTTSLYWGVLQRTPNCNKAPSHVDPTTGETIRDPALCAWGTQTINGVDYRTATVLIPYDWDWKGVT
jgi:hypothetical protein